jgi:transposase InsO family protein
MESTIGLYKTELIEHPRRRATWRNRADVETATAEWVHWYNTDRLMHRLGRIPPINYETVHYATNTAHSSAAHQWGSPEKVDAVSLLSG